MNKILKDIHWLFWGCIPIFLLYSFFAKNEIDINIHDVMFVIATKYLAYGVSLIFFITGLGYYLSYKSEKFKAHAMLTILHVALTFLGLGFLIFVPEYRYELPVETTEDMMNNHSKAMLNFNLRQFGWLSLFIAQPILILNLTIGLFRR